jgi:starvation-inducible outer membrane lipoprotein
MKCALLLSMLVLLKACSGIPDEMKREDEAGAKPPFLEQDYKMLED